MDKIKKISFQKKKISNSSSDLCNFIHHQPSLSISIPLIILCLPKSYKGIWEYFGLSQVHVNLHFWRHFTCMRIPVWLWKQRCCGTMRLEQFFWSCEWREIRQSWKIMRIISNFYGRKFCFWHLHELLLLRNWEIIHNFSRALIVKLVYFN